MSRSELKFFIDTISLEHPLVDYKLRATVQIGVGSGTDVEQSVN